MKFTEKLFGTHSERELKRIYPIVDKIEALRPTMQALTDEELRARNIKTATTEANPWIPFSRKHSQPSARQQNVPSVWNTTAYS